MPSFMALTRLRGLLGLTRPFKKPHKQHFRRPKIDCGYESESNSIQSLQELLEFNARHNPNHMFCTQLSRDASVTYEITFSQLLKAVERASAWLVKTGCTARRSDMDEALPPVGIFLTSDITIFIYIAALLRIGTPVLLLSARLTADGLQHLIAETSPFCILVNSQVLSSTASEAITSLPNHSKNRRDTPTIIQALGFKAFLDQHNPDLASCSIPPKLSVPLRRGSKDFILHSSGTTGLPKPVYHTHQFFLICATAHRLHDYQPELGHGFSSLPLYHTFGNLPVGLSLTVGMPITLLPTTTIPTGRAMTEVLNNPKIQYLFTVPSLLEEMTLLPGDQGIEVLQRLQVVAVGGAPMKEAVGDRAVEAGVPLLNHWGCTELGPITPIEIPDRSVDWRCLRPRTDTNLLVEALDEVRFQISGPVPGWTERFVVQDTLLKDPLNEGQYRLGGRQDNLVVLSTGEKVSPTLIETEVGKHPQVRDVLAFGDGQPALGLLIELRMGTDRTVFLEGLQSLLDRGNACVDKHGKVDPEMVFLTPEDTKPFIRTDKGTLSRHANLELFSEEIVSCYSRSTSSSPYPGDGPSLRSLTGNTLRESLREIVKSTLSLNDVEDDADFFDLGMDSSQVIRLRRTLQSSLNSPAASETAVDLPWIDIDPEFCFLHPSISSMQCAIEGLVAGRLSPSSACPNRIEVMLNMLKKYKQLAPVNPFLELGSHQAVPNILNKHTILITGSTGSLGSFLLDRFARNPDVEKVICLCRPPRHGGEGVEDRQRRLMEERGLALDSALWAKVGVYAADFSLPDFGLNAKTLQELTGVTHIVHNAWPVNFNRTVSSFEQQIQTVSHLIRLAAFCGTIQTHPPRFLFISSIAVAGQYVSGPVPEIEMRPEDTAEMGYAESKWIAEQLILAASTSKATDAKTTFRSSIVRIGQISGAEGSGAWNESENIPIVVKTSQKLGVLPDIEGSLSWLPVNRTADIVDELLFSERFAQFYHLENPSRQRWKDVLHNFANILDPSNTAPFVSFPEWLELVRRRGVIDNPAHSLLSFLERDFCRIAGGQLSLCTKNAQKDSATLASSEPIQPHQLKAYVDFWRQ